MTKQLARIEIIDVYTYADEFCKIAPKKIEALIIEAQSILDGAHVLGSETIRRSIQLQQSPDSVDKALTPGQS